MGNVNKVFLMGNLTRNPELLQTSCGPMAKFGIAVNETWGGRDGAEKKQRTTFVEVVAWDHTGKVISEHLKKGDPIFIDGRLDFSSWKDSQTGKNRSKLEVVVDKFQFVGTKPQEAAAPAGEMPF